MDYLQARQLIVPTTRSNVLTNTLVLIAPAASPVQLKIAPGFALATVLGAAGRLATGDPDSVPVGRYAQAALRQLGVWDAVQNKLVAADNVRTALNFVARGEAPLGIVYATDARAEPKVRVVDIFPDSSHEPITYPAAATTDAGPGALAFLAYLKGAKARAILDRAGFGRP
jgi:molybdate transport system substrate-binding protein